MAFSQSRFPAAMKPHLVTHPTQGCRGDPNASARGLNTSTCQVNQPEPLTPRNQTAGLLQKVFWLSRKVVAVWRECRKVLRSSRKVDEWPAPAFSAVSRPRSVGRFSNRLSKREKVCSAASPPM